MNNLAFLLSFATMMTLAFPALAGGLCHRQHPYGMQIEDSRECRLSRLFETWLTANGFEAEFTDEHSLAVWQRVGRIGSTLGGEFPPILPIRPAATVSIAYIVSMGETERMAAIHEFRPRFFESLDRKLKTEGKAIICETMEVSEEEFFLAGGALTFEVGLRPGFIQSGYPDWLTKVKIDQSSCEAL